MAKLTTSEQELNIALGILGNSWKLIDIHPAAVLATEHLPPFIQYSARKELMDKLYTIYDGSTKTYVVCRICGEEGHKWQQCGND